MKLGDFEINNIYNIDCLIGMKKMPNDCIDLVVTSPPYDDLRIYNGYKLDFENIAMELFRVMKKGGVVVWVIIYIFFFVFFNDTATTEIYTLSLHDALPISLFFSWIYSYAPAESRVAA